MLEFEKGNVACLKNYRFIS